MRGARHHLVMGVACFDPALTARTADVALVAAWRPDFVRAVGETYEGLASEVGQRIAELCRLQTAAVLQHEAQLGIRSPRAIADGLDEDAVQALVEGYPGGLPEMERLCADLAATFCSSAAAVEEPLLDALRAHLGTTGLEQLLLVISHAERFQRVTLFVQELVSSCPSHPELLSERPPHALAAAQAELELITRRPRDVDPVTRELVRLRNAEHQNCNY